MLRFDAHADGRMGSWHIYTYIIHHVVFSVLYAYRVLLYPRFSFLYTMTITLIICVCQRCLAAQPPSNKIKHINILHEYSLGQKHASMQANAWADYGLLVVVVYRRYIAH